MAPAQAAGEEEVERQPLLSVPIQPASPSAAADRTSSQPGSPNKAAAAAARAKQPSVGLLSTQSSGLSRIKSQELGQCRICLEEDALSNLETPCGCTGTQRHAHKECIQKWVNEKHHTTCEICDQPYQGNYVVPPPPPPTAGEPLTLVSPMGNLYLTVDDERVAGQLLHDVYDEWDDHRQPTVSWCFSFVMLLMFMMILQSTMTVPADGGAGGAGGAGGGPSPSPAADPSAAGSAAVGLLAGFSLIVMWLFSKLFLVVLPLVMLMRLATRAQEQAAEAAAAAAVGTVPGLDGPTRAPADDRDHALVTLITRLAAARAAAQARQMQVAAAAAGTSAAAAEAAAGAGSSSGNAAVPDLEMQQAPQQVRRHALSRLGRDPTFWAPAGTSSGSRTVEAAQQPAEQEQQADVAVSQRLASLRALMSAITASALRGETIGQQQQQATGGNTSATGGSSGAGGDSRHSMV